MEYAEIVQKIRNLEIQGAENIAIMATKAFGIKCKETSNIADLKRYAAELISTRPTEPAMRNALKFCLRYRKEKNVVEEVLTHFETSKQKIIEYGAKKIEDGYTIFTHCHSSTVIGIILKAAKNGKKIRVSNTETRPRYQGRITAKKLAEANIPVDHFVDSAGKIALKKADLFLFGSDAITSDGRVINKIGTATLLEMAHKYSIPSYACSNSWKFDPLTLYGAEEEIEQRETCEVWENPPEGVNIHNPAFEPVNPELITGLITELGIIKPETLMTEIEKVYPWILEEN